MLSEFLKKDYMDLMHDYAELLNDIGTYIAGPEAVEEQINEGSLAQLSSTSGLEINHSSINDDAEAKLAELRAKLNI